MFRLLLWVDLGWLLDAHPAAVSLPLLNRIEEEGDIRWKALRIEINRGHHLPVIVKGKTDSTPIQGKKCGYVVFRFFSFNLSISEEMKIALEQVAQGGCGVSFS